MFGLFVDESGAFGRRGDEVVVAGVLAQTGVDGVPLAPLDTLLEDDPRLAPLARLPWPLHAAHLRYPVLLAVGTAVAPRGTRRLDPRTGSALGVAVSKLAERQTWQACLAAIQAGSLPALAELRQLDEEAERTLAAHEYASLEHAGRIALSALKQRLRQLRGEHASIVPLTLFVAGEGKRGEAFSEDERFPSRVRYFALLEALLRRVRDVVARRAASASIHMVVLRRFDRCEPEAGSYPTRRHVHSLARRLGGERLEFIPAEPREYRGEVPAALVLADWASNGARHTLHRFSKRNLASLSLWIERNTGLQVSSGEAERTSSHLVAAGRAEQWVADSGTAQDPAPLPDGLRRWAREWAALERAARDGVAR